VGERGGIGVSFAHVALSLIWLGAIKYTFVEANNCSTIVSYATILFKHLFYFDLVGPRKEVLNIPNPADLTLGSDTLGVSGCVLFNY
jgi:hypothetical protein